MLTDTYLSLALQVLKAEPPKWSTFLASLQAGQEPVKHTWASVQPIPAHNWAGTVYWNGVWDKALDSEAEEKRNRQQAASEQASDSEMTASASTAGIYARLPFQANCLLIAQVHA